MNVSAAGGNKNYGEKDTNHGSYNDDDASNKYLNGFDVASVEGLVNDNSQYKDTIDIILGVLRREVGENVGLYNICNFRGTTNLDNVLENPNNMYLNCEGSPASEITFNDDANDFEGYVYESGILKINGDYIKSRALYIATNKTADGRTLNTTTDLRNNKFANYVINYTSADYAINAIDLVLQAAPGQRREYNYTNTYDPNPWEIILYGLVDGSIKRIAPDEEDEDKVVEFNGWTSTIIEGDYYSAEDNEKNTEGGSAASKLPANASEERTNWYLYHDDVQLIGYKTNETYSLLRSTAKDSTVGSAELIREPGKNGGWYLYYTLANDLNIVGGTNAVNESKIAVMTNENQHCTYDETGHLVTVGGAGTKSLCKNYNLIYNPYYTNAEGYTIDNHPEEISDSQFIYKSNNKTCLELDPEMPCKNTEAEPQKIYKIQFEIYRREIIMEFNSAIETIRTGNAETWNVFYGKRYNFYKNNYFDIAFYDTFNAKEENTNKLYPEDYLFLCYQNETTMARAEFDPTNPSATGCTGVGSYGLTAGDKWTNIGLTFKLHELVSADTSSYYDDEDAAIPAGVYYVYADIAEAQKVNYNFKYLGGALTIKSLAVDIELTSYVKEYGEKYYSKYGLATDYGSSFSSFAKNCILDGWLLATNGDLIDLGENVYCVDSSVDFENSENNVYGFHINGLDSNDTIAANFTGRPIRDRSVSLAADANGLQDNVGTYEFKQGTIATINNNPFATETYSCEEQIVKGDYGDCVVVEDKLINNYVVAGENRTYSFDMKTDVEEEKDVDVETPDRNVIKGYLFITPAELTITVTSGQTKMFGCAYNAFHNGTSNAPSYTYADGYSNCVEGDGNYYDLGYEFTVSGDKDYQIANNGYDYTSDSDYKVSGLKTAETFRPSTVNAGIKAHALNDGTLYRIPYNLTNKAGVIMSTYSTAAYKSQEARDGGDKLYQEQLVGNYILTLGNVDATPNAAKATYINSCDANNMPVATGGAYTCKNYDIDYYGTKVVDSSVDTEKQTYQKEDGSFPAELTFKITKRTVYVYTQYDEKIYGEADMYNDPNKSLVYLCGDNNLDGKVDENDEADVINDNKVVLKDGTIVSKDVYYGSCTADQIASNKDLDGTNNTLVEYGLTRYYTKLNSLAKYPWNGLDGRDDVQTDVITGKISRKGMNGNAPHTDDIRGFYEYVYENGDFGGTVHLIGALEADVEKYASTYGSDNYIANYYENGLAVNEKGANKEDDEDQTPIKYEIVLRQIKVAFVSFDKVYGEKDVSTDYNILVCAPTEEFDFINMKCVGKDPTDKHGLSATHITNYTNGGKLIQDKFKTDFLVRFMRVLGENVSCGTSSNVTVSLSGYFFGTAEEVTAEGTLYSKTLKCNTTAVEDKSVYETLAYIDQSLNTLPGYNYQVNYQIGHVNIVPRPILITPDSGQGFMYGDYYDTLIPSITFKDSLVKVEGDGLVQTYGLVHSTEAGSSEGVCLNNINYFNNGTIDGDEVGTCFYINDRMDEYNAGNKMTISKYDSTVVNSNTGLANVRVKNYIFGDVYESESSTRSALDRGISTSASTRYNRNVGLYTINIGDLKDQTGNYTLSFKEGVTYEIKAATATVTPDSVSTENVAGTTQTGQYKIYGEQDKELTFKVITTYKVSSSHYAINDSNIVKVVSTDGTTKTLAQLDKCTYDTDTKTFIKSATGEGDYIYLIEGDTVTVSGFAYGENNGDIRNYGKGQDGLKAGTEQKINQGSVTGSLYYDTVCKDAVEGCNADRTLSYGDSSRILLGYLYVEGWAQTAGIYNIMNGMKVAANEWNNGNYTISYVSGVKFSIIPRPIGVRIDNIEKTYGQTTDSISCEFVGNAMMTPCAVANGILLEGNTLLKNNFTVEYFDGMTKAQTILNNYTYDGNTYNNSALYSQNGKFANGLVPEGQKAYSAYGVAESKITEHLGVYVSRDERNTNNDACMYDGDTYGFCEDAGTYYLRLYGYTNTIDNISANSYQTTYRPVNPSYGEPNSGLSAYYYNSYFGYNPNYFVIVLDNDASKTAVTPVNLFVESQSSTSRSTEDEDEKLLKATGTLTINKKNVALYVNTSYFTQGLEIYYVGQNTNAPTLPVINNGIDLNYDQFNGLGAYATADRKTAVDGINSYGKVIWGTQPAQVRTGDKLEGELAYCNKIISEDAYDELRSSGVSSDYACSDLVYNDNKNSVSTNLVGYVPIVRDSAKLSIVNEDTENANKAYENKNYSVKFYPGALRIEEDDIKPVVEVNRSDVYIEANAIGTYLYECVGEQGTTTYKNCDTGISVIGKTENTKVEDGEPILKWLTDSANYGDYIIKVDLPLIAECETNEHDCTSSAYFELENGKGRTDFVTGGGIIAGEENAGVYPFTMQKDSYIKNAGPTSLKELIITMVSWFGTTAYDQAEIRNGEVLDKKFDKYWYLIIEKQGTNGEFDIARVGDYKVHFYVMDNAGNVSEGNMYEVIDEKKVLQTAHKNVGTLHIIDTTNPVVGTLNLYNGRVECTVADCTKEENWVAAENTYLPINILLRYDAEGNPDGDGEYVDIGDVNLANLSTLTKYAKVANNLGGYTYVEDSSQGKHILIPKGNKASALKHYSWSNSISGIYLTITGGSDNSYTNSLFETKNTKDYSQWNHYYSRDGGITWFLYDRSKGASYLALDSEGTREIIIKAVDSGVAITSATVKSVSYTDKYYGDGQANNSSKTMTAYTFVDTSSNDVFLKEFANLTIEEQKTKETERHTAVDSVGWNVSDAAENDSDKAEIISKLIYGKPATGEEGTATGYKFYKDKQTAYLDRTNPTIEFGEFNGEKLYVYEYGCEFCTVGYTEHYAGAIDSYPENYKTSEILSSAFDKNHSILINHVLYEATKAQEGTMYQGSYADVSQEKPGVKSDNGGLGGDAYAMNGLKAGLDIRNVYFEERRYIIYAFDKNDTRTVYDLSASIPTTIDEEAEGYSEDSIYNIIKKSPAAYESLGDYSYSIIYSVFDKAGNESIYIARGVIYADLVPDITPVVNNGEEALEVIEPNSYSMTVEQGANVEDIVNSLDIDAGNVSQFLTQTIYYNGELVVDNKKYQKEIYDGFTTSVPGVYEIIYSYQYMYYGADGQSELLTADPVKLTITVESTPPVVENYKDTADYRYLLMGIGVLLASLALCWFGLITKKRN